jgi:hypothetical protein
MTAPELRTFVRAVLDELKDEQRGRVIDSLMTRAARGDAGWKPNRPSSRIVDDARSFADAATSGIPPHSSTTLDVCFVHTAACSSWVWIRTPGVTSGGWATTFPRP